MPRREMIKIAELVEDTGIYPRISIDAQAVGYLVEAIVSGVVLPAIIVCRATRKIIDGFHRVRAFRRIFGDEAEIEVVFKDYASDKERFLDAMKYNSAHGSRLDRCDRVHCAHIAKELRIGLALVSDALHMQAKRFKELVAERTATAGKAAQPVALKRTIEHMGGRKLTTQQEEANRKLSGMRQSFYVNQVIILIENDLIDKEDAELLERMALLREKLGEYLSGK